MNSQLNTLDIAGVISSIEEVHTYHNKRTGKDEKFYEIMLDVPRLSGTHDIIPAMAPEKLIKVSEAVVGKKIAICGSLRTRNYGTGKNCHTKIYAYVKNIFSLTDEEFDDIPDKNIVRIEGIVCSHSDNYRQVGGGRIVTDVMLANNRICHRGNDYIRKSSYLPSIVWGNDAKAMVKHVNVGDEIRVEGRFQSRTYHRKNDDLDEVHVAYELSLKEFDVINKHNDDDSKKKSKKVV